MNWTNEANKRQPNHLAHRFLILWRWHFLQGFHRLTEERNYLFWHQYTSHDWDLIEGYANNAIIPMLLA